MRLPRRSRAGRRPVPELEPRDAYSLWARTYDAPPSELQRLESEAVSALMPELEARAVLDIGCGKGRTARLALKLGARHVVAADNCWEMLSAPGRASDPRLRRVACDLLELPFLAGSFDIVTCTLVLGHVRDLRAALVRIDQALRPGGTLVVSDFHPRAALRGWQRTFAHPRTGRTLAVRHHVHLFEDYARELGNLGFRWEDLREPLHDGTPVVFALRAVKRPDIPASAGRG